MKDQFIFDGHCDTAFALWEQGTKLTRNAGHCDLERAGTLPGWAQFFAFCPAASPQLGRLSPEQLLLQPYRYFCKCLEELEIPICSTPQDVHNALDRQKPAALLSLEGAEGISCDSGRLELLRQMGFSMVSLTWNNENALAGSHMSGQGLSARGKTFVREAQARGLIVDVSHCADAAFWDVVRMTDGPIVASHSNSRAVCPHSRNLSDDMYKAICETGGTVGINLYAEFLAPKAPDFETVWRHVDHFLQLAGTDTHVALGADLDGCDALPMGFSGLESYPSLLDFFRMRGLPGGSLDQITNENWMEVFQTCTKKARS